MENFPDDDLALVILKEPSSTLPKPKLKRLKKVKSPSLSQELEDPMVPKSQGISILPAASFPTERHVRSSDLMCSEFSSKEESPTYLDPLFTDQSVVEGRDASSMLESEGTEENKEVVAVEESKKEKTVKRRLSLEDEEEDPNKKKKKKERSRKIKEHNGMPIESVREKKKLEKERKLELEHLHAESQRLLRETRDASFKPVLHIKKPISSVLDKIRLRKLELLKSWMPSIVESDCPNMSGSSSDLANHQNDGKNIDDSAKASDDDSKCGYQNLTGAKIDNMLSNGDNCQFNDLEASPSNGDTCLLNELEARPSLYPPTSSLKIDCCDNTYVGASVGGFNVSSSEEESDKENIGPGACKFTKMDSSPKKGLAKAFLDDEAEEEYDSDGDLQRSQEFEEENETENEDLVDLFATGNDEMPMDQEKRNELHQKWLEQQDAAETENVLQRLKCRQGRRSSFIHGESDCFDGSDGDDDDDDNNASNNSGYTSECDDETAYKSHTMHTALQGLKKAKQTICQMFTDANDVYIPSDDEENERNFIRHNLLKRNEEPSIISPVEDENSRDFFGLIKKLNIAPASKKRGKASASLFDPLVSGNSNTSSKSSFINRACNSLPTSRKHGTTAVKTFIFGRDDSNSRSNISTPDINSDIDQTKGNNADNAVVTDMTRSSQMKSSLNKRKAQAESESRSSLFNILRQSSVKFESKSYTFTESQAAHKFSAFKLRRT